MDKKELILTVAKDFILENKLYHCPSDKIEVKTKELGKVLESIVKEVERVYNVISD